MILIFPTTGISLEQKKVLSITICGFLLAMMSTLTILIFPTPGISLEEKKVLFITICG